MEPEFITLGEIKLAGMQTFGNVEQGSPPEMWQVLMNNPMDVPDRVNPELYYGLESYTREMESTGKWFYLAGVEVSGFESLPVQLCARRIPASEYAVFEYHGAISPRLKETFEYIYRQWLPQSGYMQNGPYDLERYDTRFKGPDNEKSVFEILIPVTRCNAEEQV